MQRKEHVFQASKSFHFGSVYVQELSKAQKAVVLVLKRLKRRGNGLKSHPTEWEKPGMEPATRGLQDIGWR